MADTYDVSGILPEGTLDDLPRGTNIVLTGPSMVGKREVALQLLAAGFDYGEGILTVTTDGRVGYEDFERYVPSVESDRIAILDCSGDRSKRETRGPKLHVSSPADLTGISISMAKQLKALESQDLAGIRYGLVSVSTLLQFLDTQTVFKFLHVYTARVEETGGLGIFTLNDDAHDAQTTNTILGQFDFVVRLRETDAGDREVQVRGGGGPPSPWLDFPY